MPDAAAISRGEEATWHEIEKREMTDGRDLPTWSERAKLLLILWDFQARKQSVEVTQFINIT